MGVIILGRHPDGTFAYEFTAHSVKYGGPTMRYRTYQEAEDAQITQMQRLGVWCEAKKNNLIKAREKANFPRRNDYPDVPRGTATSTINPPNLSSVPTHPSSPSPSATERENSLLRNENLRLKEDALRQRTEIHRLRSQLTAIQQMISATLQ